jgi:hexosaminidase
MRLLVLPAFLATISSPLAAQSKLQLRWELLGDSIAGDRGFSRAAFTITNRDTKPLAPTGWAIYYSALQGADSGTVGAGFAIADTTGDLHRLAPGTGFAGLAPGASIRIEYRTDPLLNTSFVPKGPYIVFDAAKDVGVALSDYTAVPFERSAQDPRVVTPEAQFALDSVIHTIPASELPPVFPTPLEVTPGAGTLHLAALPSVTAPEALRTEAAFAAEYLRPYFRGTGQGTVPLQLEVGAVAGQTSLEAYTLVVDPAQGIHIVGASPAGVFYGLQSLRSMLPPSGPAPRAGGGVDLPAIRVVDAPRFGYRGFMLDVARNFHPKPVVLRTLDLLARYKINVFHVHLTDDEGWRIELPSLPELTAVGARRGHPPDAGHLPPAFGSGPAVDRPFGSGFYSRADWIEILRYAAARHIEVVPEIEMPGHARAAVKALKLSEPGDTSKYTTAQGYHDNVLNPALETTYAFIEHVVQDLAAIHREAGVPLRHIHMGGDEVPNGVWVGSPAVQAYMKAHNLASVDDMWFVFYGRVEQIVKAQGVALGGWEEIAVRRTQRDGQRMNIANPDFATHGWRAYVWNNVPGWGNEDLAYRLANGGYDVVLGPVSNFYFDLAWNQNPEESGLDWGGYVDLRKPFEFIPFDYYRNVQADPAVFVGKDRLTDYGRTHILGLQGNLWSETLGADGRVEYMIAPRLLALAERAWAADPDWAKERDPARSAALFRDSWSRFVNVVGQRELPRLDREVPSLGYRIPTPGLKNDGGTVRCSVELPGFTLRYTTDGREPTVRSAVVRGPIPFRGTVRVAAFTTTGRKGHTARLTAP